MKLESVMIEKKEIEGGIEFNLSGEDVGFVIGRRGETLDSLQYLTSLVANHSDNSYFKVTIDTGNYRKKKRLLKFSVSLLSKLLKQAERQILSQ